MSKIVYDHIAQLENVLLVDAAWKPDRRVSWEELKLVWAPIEGICEQYGYDIFRAEEDRIFRGHLTNMRHAMLAVAAHAACEIECGKGPPSFVDGHALTILQMDVEQLRVKDAAYGSSWKRRGGVGAFMMLCRKWDRIEQQIKHFDHSIHAAMVADRTPEGIHDDVGDLRRYLILVEAEILAREAWKP